MQNVFSLFSISTNNALIARNSLEILPWDNKTVQNLGMQKTIENVSLKLLQNAEAYIAKFGRDTSQIPKEKIFECYISKYYNIREGEKFLFGENSVRSSGVSA